MNKNKVINAVAVATAVVCLSTPILAEASEIYTVKKDDTLWKISKFYGLSLDSVIESNSQLENPDLIYPGDVVCLPISSSNKTLIGASVTYESDKTVEYNKDFGKLESVKAPVTDSSSEAKVAELVNAERQKAGLPLLSLSADISNVARVKSEDMAKTGYFDHTSPKYGSPFEMLKLFGITYTTAGENIAKGQKTPNDVMTAWMNSEGHRKNILNPNFKEIGVGISKDSSGSIVWTQQFIAR